MVARNPRSVNIALAAAAVNASDTRYASSYFGAMAGVEMLVLV